MSSTEQAVPAISSLIRVTAVAGDRRADLVLPGTVPVIELLPEITRQAGVLDRDMVHGGCRLVTQDGRQLVGEASLIAQSIDDGHVLSVVAGVNDEPPRVYDDAVEAMSDAVESDARPWDPAAARRTALTAAVMLLGVGAATLGLQRPSVVAGSAAIVAALVLLTGAVVLARVRSEPETAVVLAWTAVLFGVVGGITAVPAGPLLQTPAAVGGGVALLIGLLAMMGLLDHRPALVPAVAVGSVFAVSSAVLAVTTFDTASVYAVAVVFVVVAGSLLPWLAVGATGAKIEQAHTHSELVADPPPIDAVEMRGQARIGHEVLLAVSATVGVLLVLTAPLLVSLGLTGTLLAVCAAAILMLRTRQYRSGNEVLAGLTGGILALLVTAVSVAVIHPDWRPALTVVLAAVGAGLLATTLLPGTASVRRGRLGDLAEGTALVALLPLLVIAIGLASGVRG